MKITVKRARQWPRRIDILDFRFWINAHPIVRNPKSKIQNRQALYVPNRKGYDSEALFIEVDGTPSLEPC